MTNSKSTKSVYLISSCLIVLMTISGCIKRRPDQALQGSGLSNGDVVKKEAVLGVNETVTSIEKLQDATTREYTLTIEDSAKNMFDDLGYVEYETESVLLKNNPRFIGKPGVTYELKRVLQGERLLIYKVSRPENISYIEKTSLVKEFEDGQIGVPFLSFPVSYFNVRFILDSDNRRTNQKTEELVRDPSKFASATHIQVNWSNRIVLTEQGLDKSSLFPKSYFKEGEWYYTATKVDSSDYQSGGNTVVYIVTERANNQYGVMRNIKFQEYDQTTLAGVSTALPQEYSSNVLSESVVAPLKVKWINLRVNSQITGLQTEELDNTGHFRNSEYFQIDFLETFKALSSSFQSMTGDSGDYNVNKVDEVIIAGDLFSFIVQNQTEKFRINFMRKKPSSYKPLSVHNDDLQRKFGAYYMQKPTHEVNLRLSVEDDFYRFFRIMRFNPENKDIVYHISKESPETAAVQESTSQAIKYLNDSLKHIFRDKPEDAIRISLSNERVRRGDPRYNIIDFNSVNNMQTAGGLGPWNSDEVTGEVVSANSFIYYGIAYELLKIALSEYLGSETGFFMGQLAASSQLQDNFVMAGEAPNFGYIPPEYKENLISELGNSPYGQMFNFFNSGNERSNPFITPCVSGSCDLSATDHPNQVISSRQGQESLSDFLINNSANSKANLESLAKTPHNVFSINRRTGVKAFKEVCDYDRIKGIYTQARASSSYLENSTVEACLQKVLAKVFVPTIVHEVLHNFGLQHNMHGSTDEANYLTPELIKTVYNEDVPAGQNPSQSNSIMDYFEYRTEDSPYPSTYDWAALRYLYRYQVQLTNGQFVNLVKSPSEKVAEENVIELKSIKSVEQNNNVKAKHYDFCMQAEISWGTNPLCDTFDIGSSPYTIVQNYIEEFNYNTSIQTIRAGRFNYNPDRVNRSKQMLVSKMMKYYQFWRKELITILGEQNKYLESYNSAEEFYNAFAGKVAGLPTADRTRVLEYYQVRNLIYSFLRDQIFEAPLTCAFIQQIGENKGPVFLDFDQIYRRLTSVSETFDSSEITGCTDNAVQQVAKVMLTERLVAVNAGLDLKTVKYDFFAQLGTPVRNYASSLYDSRYLPGNVDISGSGFGKMVSAYSMLGRQYTPFYNSDEYYFPTMMDEPEFRDNFETLIKNRYVHGFWVDDKSSDLNNLSVSSETLNEILSSPEHQGFRLLMNTYGPRGAREFGARIDSGVQQLVTELNNSNQEVFSFIALSPYVHNLSIKKLEADETIENSADIFGKLYNKVFVNSFMSESQIIPFYSNMFRASLSVPNNLSVTAKRTERFLMGISSNDYAYMEFVRSRYKFVADLGSFLVYPKNDSATFSRELIAELDDLNSYGQGFANANVDIQSMMNYLNGMLSENFNSFGNRTGFGMGTSSFPSVEEYLTMVNTFQDKINHDLLRTDLGFNNETKGLLVSIANNIMNSFIRSMNQRANQIEIEAFDRFGNKLTYLQALEDISNLKAMLDQMENGLQLPATQLDRASYQRTYDALVSVVTEFQKNQGIAGDVTTVRPGLGEAHLVYNPIISNGEIMEMIQAEFESASIKNLVYKFDANELDEKKEQLNKFLYILAISRM